MLTIDALREFGADIGDGMRRCLNNEAFYLQLVKMAAADNGFEKLAAAVESGDLKAAFECAHSLKGVLGNLALTPLFRPVSEITELLRAGTETDYSSCLEEINKQKEQLRALCAE